MNDEEYIAVEEDILEKSTDALASFSFLLLSFWNIGRTRVATGGSPEHIEMLLKFSSPASE